MSTNEGGVFEAGWGVDMLSGSEQLIMTCESNDIKLQKYSFMLKGGVYMCVK